MVRVYPGKYPGHYVNYVPLPTAAVPSAVKGRARGGKGMRVCARAKGTVVVRGCGSDSPTADFTVHRPWPRRLIFPTTTTAAAPLTLTPDPVTIKKKINVGKPKIPKRFRTSL